MTERNSNSDKAAEIPVIEKTPESGQRLSVDNQEATKAGSADLSSRLGSINEQMMGNGMMPSMDQAGVPATVAKAAQLFDGQNLGVRSDNGLSSATAVSSLLKASGAEIAPTMNVENLANQLEKAGWQKVDITSAEQAKPGDIIFTNTDRRPGRNVGIVGEDGKIYSHNFRTKNFEGREHWSSKFVSVMRPPSDK